MHWNRNIKHAVEAYITPKGEEGCIHTCMLGGGRIRKAAYRAKALIYQLRKKILSRLRGKEQFSDALEEPAQGNPYLPKLRAILEQVLTAHGMGYQGFKPLLVDTDRQPESLLDEDEVEVVLEQISPDLNFLRIATERPAYFAAYIEKMYEETGLVVQVEEKGQASPEGINVVLDMEWEGGFYREYLRDSIVYLPIYKRPWKEMNQNLDISIPIGYNTMIVKG